jgi:hypothetical protein
MLHALPFNALQRWLACIAKSEALHRKFSEKSKWCPKGAHPAAAAPASAAPAARSKNRVFTQRYVMLQ